METRKTDNRQQTTDTYIHKHKNRKTYTKTQETEDRQTGSHTHKHPHTHAHTPRLSQLTLSLLMSEELSTDPLGISLVSFGIFAVSLGISSTSVSTSSLVFSSLMPSCGVSPMSSCMRSPRLSPSESRSDCEEPESLVVKSWGLVTSFASGWVASKVADSEARIFSPTCARPSSPALLILLLRLSLSVGEPVSPLSGGAASFTRFLATSWRFFSSVFGSRDSSLGVQVDSTLLLTTLSSLVSEEKLAVRVCTS